MFSKMLKDSFTTQRLVLSGEKKTWTDNLVDEAGMLQPLGETQIDDGGLTSKAYRLFCLQSDILESDRIIIGSTTYTIDTIKDYNFGRFPHFELTISEIK